MPSPGTEPVGTVGGRWSAWRSVSGRRRWAFPWLPQGLPAEGSQPEVLGPRQPLLGGVGGVRGMT